MGNAIGQTLALAVGVALSPASVVAVILMLITPRARSNGLAFVAGWLVGLAIVGTIVLLIAGPAEASEAGDPATWVDVLELVIGVVLLWVALNQWRRRPHEGEDAPTPKWMRALDDFTPPKAAGAGVALTAANPKNLLLAVAAAAAIAQTGIPAGEQAVAYAVFALVGTAGVAAPIAIFFALGDRSGAVLERLKDWMADHNGVIMAVLCLVIGAKLIGDGISGLS